ncbi:hypothetical protein GGF43_002949 [Coemansia sp. RSA 2618]|nr:hypothetical protein GGF43_002949 [Coemansia sp. RSA 2618]
MVAQFRKAHSDVDIPHELIAEAFSEAAADTVWDERAPIKGNNVACCRPALDEEDLRAHCTDYEQAAMFLHKQEVKPLLQSVDGSEFGWSSRREWAIYAGGECNSELWALPLPSAEDAALRDCGFWPREPADMPIPTSDADVRLSLEFTTPIRQIISHDSHPGRACVRTDSMVTLVDLIQRHSGSSRIPHVDANIAGSPYTYDTGDRWTCHASWNARNASEIALASGTGCVRLWDYATSRDTLLRGADTDMQYDIQWNCCDIYRNLPVRLASDACYSSFYARGQSV